LRGAFDFLKYFAFRESFVTHLADQSNTRCTAQLDRAAPSRSSATDVVVSLVSTLKMAESLAISGAL
jgi:hypothetical protein